MKQPLLKIWFAFFLIFFTNRSNSQDIHFTQFYASPLTLNPALTGYSEGDYRAAAIYRNQWQSVTTPFQTYGASFDSKILRYKLKNDILGGGIVFNADKAGTGKLFFIQALASISYHKSIDKAGKHYVALGFQAGFVQKSIQYNLLSFPEQFDGVDFDRTLANGESFSSNSVKYADINMGVLWYSNFSERIGAFAGFSYLHINRPKETFLGQTNKLPSRYTGHAGMSIGVVKNFYIKPNFIYMYQTKAQEINLGTAFEYHIPMKKDNKLVTSVGAWYRLNDATSVSASLEYMRFRAGFAYDVNVSNLKPASNLRGAFEIYVMYTGFYKGSAPKPIRVVCPMM